jgi:hypothetical protein
MREFLAGALAVVLLLVWELLNHWGVLASALEKLKASGASGNFLANIILSPLLPLILGTAALVLVYKGSREIVKDRAKEIAPAQLPPIENRIDNSPKVQVSPKVVVSPQFTQQVVIGREEKPPVESKVEKEQFASLSFLKAKQVLLREDQRGVWHEASTNLEYARKGIVAPFKNVPKQIGEHTPTAGSVTASLVFRNPANPEEIHINHGVWLRHYEHGATFSSGETNYLLVALKQVHFVTFENPNTHNPLQGRWRSGMSIHYPQAIPLRAEGEVEIVLVDRWNVTLFQGIFDYKLSVEEMILTLRPES